MRSYFSLVRGERIKFGLNLTKTWKKQPKSNTLRISAAEKKNESLWIIFFIPTTTDLRRPNLKQLLQNTNDQPQHRRTSLFTTHPSSPAKLHPTHPHPSPTRPELRKPRKTIEAAAAFSLLNTHSSSRSPYLHSAEKTPPKAIKVSHEDCHGRGQLWWYSVPIELSFIAVIRAPVFGSRSPYL
ncbi:hypothetical protein A4A49_33311 [Nicotiana attenuata]|uniref:Uncharacterized protein n=1 Tax=Nicotiana attenuata TaxID=49451 RepID=A0A1J6KJZ3_NICAT|nr:hypothetical protein A4A49_33311 [Nicotiana attenuata]